MDAPGETTEVVVTEPLAHGVETVAAMLDVSRKQVWRLVAEGALPTFRIGRRKLIRHDDVLALIARLSDQGL